MLSAKRILKFSKNTILKVIHRFDSKNVVFSIGENCLTDDLLSRNNLKSFSSPWSTGRSNIEYILAFEREQFLDLLNPKYLKYENDGEKHKWNARYGWFRYDSRFALPVYREDGEVSRYNVFHASMLIRHDNDGKLYLYDILDIKK